ncbi:MAG TPA: fibronectin type III domain-containing protein [Candidatus Krumholzibacteria bacterium]|nr:fibronectin type III domain-containing protein [Candidatus Krumholzibacteria bacterium]HPD71223.1 fibronectin type III domain-containing protein [Candidatus Krumholzibacteria bacterium]HRY39077.1 fibronectin type III domain-containing protein [Candidatus Krumholzibacteria bacterium]
MAKTRQRTAKRTLCSLIGLLALSLLPACDENDVSPPVAPTQVYTVSGDGRITVYWNDYPEIYSDDISGYRIWSRYYQVGDEDDPARDFFVIGEVAVRDNYDADWGQYHYVDTDVENGVDYEYAVTAVSPHGESYRSFEIVIDTPLPMSESPLTIFDVAGPNHHLAGFDFSLAAEHGAYDDNGAAGLVDPTVGGTTADVRVRFDTAGIPWLETMRADVHVQDYGTFLDGNNQLDFAGVSWAPEFGWSESGVLELIVGHIYVVEIYNEPDSGDIHYAKLGVASVDGNARFARIMWAYQSVNGLPELAAPQSRGGGDDGTRPISL